VKFLCPACDRLLEVTSFRLEGSALVLSCSRCGSESRARSESVKDSPPPSLTPSLATSLAPSLTPSLTPTLSQRERGPEDPFEVPKLHCPKCIAPYSEGAASCAQCGLTFANVASEEYRPTEGVSLLWEKLLSRWDDEAAHDQFLQAAIGQNELPAAGRLYRLRLAYAPKDAGALRGRDEVLRLATVTSAVLEKSSSDAARVLRWQHVALAVFFLLCAAVVYLVYRQFVLRGL
jgi:DNA-directed RNA polymerase subunit M/transcription elongation factor TFIIS